MAKRFFGVYNDMQDRNSLAWKKLCEYIDELAESGGDEFSPRESLGNELFEDIWTLPETIAKLKRVRKVWLYGSRLRRIPPEIGEMESLEYFDPYTSYDLHWFPYEITKCRRLSDSRISTRALYGNFKNRMQFPSLHQKPLKYHGDVVKCSVCGKPMTYEETDQLWISLWVGTDIVPLLANLCSRECESSLPKPPEGYVQHGHKGGPGLKQPPDERLLLDMKMQRRARKRERAEEEAAPDASELKRAPGTLKPLKLIRKIWER